MIDTLSLKLRRALALALLVALLLAVYGFAVEPFTDAFERDSQSIEQLRMVLARYQKAAGELPDLTGRLEELRRRGPAQAGYLEGQNETVTAAILQDRLKSLVQSHGGMLKSTQVMTANKDDGEAKRVTVRGEMIATVATLQRVIYDLEAGLPILFIENLDVRTVVGPRSAADPNQDVQVEIHFDVYGYMRRSA
jgi:general secretion pathway protein M